MWQAALITPSPLVCAGFFSLDRRTVDEFCAVVDHCFFGLCIEEVSFVDTAAFALGALFALWFCAAIASKLGTVGQVGAPLFLLAFLLFGALFLITALAFPLAITAVATENSDCFDATPRGISYVTQRFLFFLIYSFFVNFDSRWFWRGRAFYERMFEVL